MYIVERLDHLHQEKFIVGTSLDKNWCDNLCNWFKCNNKLHNTFYYVYNLEEQKEIDDKWLYIKSAIGDIQRQIQSREDFAELEGHRISKGSVEFITNNINQLNKFLYNGQIKTSDTKVFCLCKNFIKKCYKCVCGESILSTGTIWRVWLGDGDLLKEEYKLVTHEMLKEKDFDYKDYLFNVETTDGLIFKDCLLLRDNDKDSNWGKLYCKSYCKK